jgi:hypothetical protein
MFQPELRAKIRGDSSRRGPGRDAATGAYDGGAEGVHPGYDEKIEKLASEKYGHTRAAAIEPIIRSECNLMATVDWSEYSQTGLSSHPITSGEEIGRTGPV